MYILGGYILTEAQLLDWCQRQGITIQPPFSIRTAISKWLLSHPFKIRLVSVPYQESMYIIATDVGRPWQSVEPIVFEESDNTRKLKEDLGLGEVEYGISWAP
jgi:hypothetical protein